MEEGQRENTGGSITHFSAFFQLIPFRAEGHRAFTCQKAGIMGRIWVY
jgi:hypothetical protein